MPSTVRTELNKLDFDWKNGELVLQEGDSRRGLRPPQRVQAEHPEVDRRFSNGANSIDLPRLVAADQRYIYIPFRDEHSSGLRRVARSIRDYVNGSAGALPYPA